MRWHANQHFTDADREAAIKALVREARKGRGSAIDTLTRLIGDPPREAAAGPTVNVLTVLAQQPDARDVMQRLFVALATAARPSDGAAE